MSLGRAISIIEDLQKAIEDKKNSNEEKEKIIQEFEDKIKNISKMNTFEYLRHINGENENEKNLGRINSQNENEEDENSNSTTDEVEKKIDNLEELIKKYKAIKDTKLKKTKKICNKK